VRLHFAEGVVAAAGRRPFDVFVNGGRVLYTFDVFAAAGGRFRAVVREALVVADAQGRIVLSFESVVNFAKVSGVLVY
jgi:hypothetical protein